MLARLPQLTIQSAGAIWSGRPGRLLAPAPLQIRTCGITASGSSNHGFAAFRSPDALFADVSLTQNYSSTRSRCVSFRRFRDPALRFPPLAPAGDSSPASQVSIRVLRLPAVHSASLPFVRSSGTTDYCSSRGSGELLLPAPRRNCAGASILCLRLTLVETTGSPRFRGNPFANMPCSSTPADRMRQGH
jgi:hypothetical protein